MTAALRSFLRFSQIKPAKRSLRLMATIESFAVGSKWNVMPSGRASINILLIHYPRLFSNSGIPFILVSRPWQTNGSLDWGAREHGIRERLGSLSSNVTGRVKSDPHL